MAIAMREEDGPPDRRSWGVRKASKATAARAGDASERVRQSWTARLAPADLLQEHLDLLRLELHCQGRQEGELLAAVCQALAEQSRVQRTTSQAVLALLHYRERYRPEMARLLDTAVGAAGRLTPRTSHTRTTSQKRDDA